MRGLSPPSLYFPRELLDDAARRLSWAAMGISGLSLAVALLQVIYGWLASATVDLWFGLPPTLLIMGLSLGLLALRRLGLSVRRLLWVGQLYQVAVCFVLAYQHWMPYQASLSWRPSTPDLQNWAASGPSWVAVTVLLFSIFVPSHPRSALITAFCATTCEPLAYFLASRLYTTLPPFEDLSVYFAVQYVVALIAWLQSLIVLRFVTRIQSETKLGAYTLLERIGGGGMGEVWAARHRLIARKAAIKLISQPRPEAGGESRGGRRQPGMDREDCVRRFEREAQITALLTSINTVALYDFGVTDDGVFYSVMELLDGDDLEKLVRKTGPLPSERVLHYLVQATRSLEEAHASGLIHRDIKPSNLFACRAGMVFDHLKVLDFGLVGLRATVEGEQVMGNVDTIAPEQIRNRPLDGRADLYALAATGYYLLTGRHVFSGSSAAVLGAHLGEEPVPPGRFAPVLPELEAVLLDCLSKEPEERPEDAAALRGRLERIETPEPWTHERARRWWEDYQR